MRVQALSSSLGNGLGEVCVVCCCVLVMAVGRAFGFWCWHAFLVFFHGSRSSVVNSLVFWEAPPPTVLLVVVVVVLKVEMTLDVVTYSFRLFLLTHTTRVC